MLKEIILRTTPIELQNQQIRFSRNSVTKLKMASSTQILYISIKIKIITLAWIFVYSIKPIWDETFWIWIMTFVCIYILYKYMSRNQKPLNYCFYDDPKQTYTKDHTNYGKSSQQWRMRKWAFITFIINNYKY